MFGPIRYIVESSYTSIGYVVQNYLSMSTWMDPLRLTAGDNGMGFPQNWTVFFIANCLIAISVVPFFIAYTLVISGFTQCNRACGQETDLKGRLFAAVALYITPIAVTLVNTSLEQMKALITLTSYPMGVLLIIILIGFRRDLKKVDIDHYDPAVGIDPRIFDDEYADDAISHEAAEAH